MDSEEFYKLLQMVEIDLQSFLDGEGTISTLSEVLDNVNDLIASVDVQDVKIVDN